MIGIGLGLPFIKPSGFTGLLDLYPNSAGAFSLRKLRDAYTGNCIRVRRSSDNTEQDFGFSSNVLDTASLLSFCGAGNGFVVTWYDQSGNSRDVTQTTAANQPQIVASGVLNTVNSKASINFNGTSHVLLKTAFGSTNSVTNFAVYRNSSLLNNPNVFSIGTNGVNTAKAFGLNTSTGFQRMFAGTSLQFNVASVVNTHYLGYTFFNGASSQIAVNGASAVVGDAGTNTAADLAIGAGLALSNNFNGPIQEVILYGSNQSANKSAIETLINSYYGIY